jgi:molybdenum cofactor guanylyltransferase
MPELVAVVLAGGLARRMGGGDKCRIVVEGRTVLERTRAVLAGLTVAINANGDPARFADTGLPVLPDALPGHPGPLAGVEAGLAWAEARGAGAVISVPGDCPFLPDDRVPRLRAAAGAGGLAVAASGGRTHPVVGCWPVALRPALRGFLLAGGRKVGGFVAQAGAAVVDWPVADGDPFRNLNTPDDLRAVTPGRGPAPP